MIPTITLAITLTLWLTGHTGTLAFALGCVALWGVMNYANGPNNFTPN